MSQDTDQIEISRRTLLKGATGLSFVIAMPGLIAACNGDVPTEISDGIEPNAWLHISPTGEITIQVPAAEMGQGPMTSLPRILAEELDADWADVRSVQVTVPRKEFGNPFFGGIVYTGGSRAIDGYFMPLRRAGAQARLILMGAAAKHWGVALDELATEPSHVIHAPSKRALSYGDIAGFATIPEALPAIADEDLKDPHDFRLIGYNTTRLDVPLKVSGKAEYAMDVQVPGMVYAAIAHAPVEDETPLAIDDTEALQVPGVLKVLPLANAVAIIAETVEATRLGKAVLKVDWSTTSTFRSADSAAALLECSAIANDLGKKGYYRNNEGDVEVALEAAAATVSAEYFADHVYHAQMEPLNATANVSVAGDAAEIWIGTQSQTITLLSAAKTLGISQDKIKLNQMYLGGGFGRRAELKQTYLIEALQLSKQLKKPVKVIWSREDDLTNGWFRPATAQLMRAGFDAAGDLTAWSHRMAGPSVLAFYNAIRWKIADGDDIVSMFGTEIASYKIPNKRAEHMLVDRQARLAPWRGVAAGYTKFAVESFVDELAESRGEDPIAFRLNRLNISERAARVVEAVAKASNWGKARAAGRAVGAALVEYHASVAAGVFEISLDQNNGKITVHNVWIAADPGLVIQPLNVEMQLEGSVIFGLGQSLTERVSIEDGQVQQSNFHDYHVPRMQDTPEIHIQLIPTDNPPSGVGELTLPLTAPAIANALKALTGKRVRHMPLTRQRVLDAIKA